MGSALQQGQVVSDGDVEEAVCLLYDPADGLQVAAAVPGDQQTGGGLGAEQRVGSTMCTVHHHTVLQTTLSNYATHCAPSHSATHRTPSHSATHHNTLLQLVHHSHSGLLAQAPSSF